MKNKLSTLFAIITIATLSLTNLFSNNSEINTNTIHLIGENHYNYECINIRNKLSKEAKKSEIILALESKAFGEPETNIFGIEDNETYLLTWFLSSYRKLALYKIMKTISLCNNHSWIPLTNTYENELFNNDFSFPSRTLSEISSQIFNSDSKLLYNKYPEIITEFVNLYKLKQSPKAYKRKINELTQDHSFKKPFFLKIYNKMFQWLNLYVDMINLCCEKLVSQNEQLPLDAMNKINIHISKIEEYTNMDANKLKDVIPAAINEIASFDKAMEAICLNHRNQIFLKNIITIFENNKSQKKPFYIIVGAAHATFLYAELVKKGYEVELNDIAQEYYDKHLLESTSSTKSEL